MLAEPIPHEKRNRRRNLRIALVVGVISVAIVAATIIVLMPPLLHLMRGIRHVSATKQRLLDDVDHELVAAAARQMMASLTRPDAWYVMGSGDERNVEVPQDIRTLGANTVLVEEDSVKIEFGGGFKHYGLIILQEGDDAHAPDRYEYTPLANGIWFYEEISQ